MKLMKLYKVKIETEIMVISDNESSAVEIAKKNAANEVGMFCNGFAIAVKYLSELPNDWKENIPYAKEGILETRKCKEIVGSSEIVKEELHKEEIDEIIKIKNESISSVVDVKKETKIDIKPKELEWKETKSEKEMKSLRFVR